MADFTATFETGINGATIATGDAGSATAWDFVGNLPKYSNTHVHREALAASFSSTTQDRVGWTLSTSNHYGRAYIYMTTLSPFFVFIQVLNSAANAAVVWLWDDGKLLIQDTAAGGHTLQMTNTLTLNAWTRVEWHVIHSTTVGQIELKMFNDPESSIPTEVLTSPASWNTNTGADQIMFGSVTTAPATFWMDDIVANATAYPGPAPLLGLTPNLAPVILGRGAC